MNRTPLFWIVALVVALAAGWQLASAQGDKAKAVQKWEYRTMTGGDDAYPQDSYMKELKEVGEQGWELVAVEPATQYAASGNRIGKNARIFHLKRPR